MDMAEIVTCFQGKWSAPGRVHLTKVVAIVLLLLALLFLFFNHWGLDLQIDKCGKIAPTIDAAALDDPYSEERWSLWADSEQKYLEGLKQVIDPQIETGSKVNEDIYKPLSYEVLKGVLECRDFRADDFLETLS